jgi:hypothetical protein
LLKELISKKSTIAPSIPIWLLNDKLNKQQLSLQITKMREQGIEKFAVKAEHGVIPEYQTADFLDYFSHILYVAKSNNMSVLFADDLQYSHPGIHAQLTAAYPKYRLQYLTLSNVIKAKGPKKFSMDLDRSKSAFIYTLKLKDRILDFHSLRNLSAQVKDNRLTWKMPSGDWRIFIFRKCYNKKPIGSYAINCFDSTVSKAYIKALFYDFKEALPKSLRSTLSGFLLELPSIAPDTSIRGIPWSKAIQSSLKSACSTDLNTIILALFRDHFSHKNGFIRRNYYNLLMKLFGNNFIKPIQEAGRRTHLKTQLFLNAGNLFSGDTLLRFNYQELINKFDLSGISSNVSYSVEQSGPVRLFSDLNHYYSKEAGTTIIGRNRNGVGYSLKDLKYESDMLSLVGLHSNYIDGNYYNLKYRSGLRAPANTFIYSSFFTKYASFLTYLKSKIGVFEKLSHMEDVGVLFPCESFYSLYNPSKLSTYKIRINNFDALIQQLVADGINFNLITESLAAQLVANHKGEALLKIKNKTKAIFKVLIIPETIIIPKRLISILEKFVKRGGKVIFFGITPYETFEQGKNQKLFRQLEKLQSQILGSVYKLTKIEELDSLKNICLKTIEKPVEIYSDAETERRILYRAFTDGKVNYYLLLNTSRSDNVRCELKMNDYGYLYYFDLNKGALASFQFTNQSDGIKPFIYNFSPAEAAIFVLADSKLPAHPISRLPIEDASRIYRIILKDEWDLKALDYNALPVNSWSMRINSNREVNTGFNMAYENYINVEHIPPKSFILLNNIINAHINGLDSGFYPVEISFNGVILKSMHFFGRGEQRFRETEAIKKITYGGLNAYAADVTTYVRKGINRITIKTFGSSFHPLIIKYPLVFLGDFGLKRGNQGWLISLKNETFYYGSWTEQGFPFYCGRAVYQQIFEKPGNFKRVLLRFKNFESHLTVRINGHTVDVLPWQPAVSDITKFIQSDKNKIEIEVANNHNNLLKMINMPSGLTAEVYLDIYQ